MRSFLFVLPKYAPYLPRLVRPQDAEMVGAGAPVGARDHFAVCGVDRTRGFGTVDADSVVRVLVVRRGRPNVLDGELTAEGVTSVSVDLRDVVHGALAEHAPRERHLPPRVEVARRIDIGI